MNNRVLLKNLLKTSFFKDFAYIPPVKTSPWPRAGEAGGLVRPVEQKKAPEIFKALVILLLLSAEMLDRMPVPN